MATRQSQKIEPPKVIGAISKFAGALVGIAVVTGKRIVKTAAQAGEEPSAKPEGKSARAPAKKRKKAAVKTKAKGRKVKKKVQALAGRVKHPGRDLHNLRLKSRSTKLQFLKTA